MLRKLYSPKFWNNPDSLLSKCLLPIAKVYCAISNFRKNSITPKQVSVPVICVGNIINGGAGKTPTVELVCNILKKHLFNPHILTAGYGGYLKNVIQVDPNVLSYLQVGDESLLSAMVSPTWVGKNRIKASNAAILAGADVIVMDDGFQNNSIFKDYKILVVDSSQQFANEYLFPAGPLIEPLKTGIDSSDIVLIIGDKNDNLEQKIKKIRDDIPIFRAKMKAKEIPEIKRVIAFCGLGYPPKFKKTLKECNYDIIDFIAFADHHPYTITEIQRLMTKAKEAKAALVTTMKDYVKIPDVFKPEINVVSIELIPESDNFANTLLDKIKGLQYIKSK